MSHAVSVLVDGDNISGKHAGKILAVAARHGEPTVARVYTDAQRPSDWHGAVGYRMLHAGTGKNAADLLLALDAMEMVLSKNVLCFVIASSDGDFTHLATRLRELGAKVIGIGEEKAPPAFRACCTSFVEIGQKQAKRPVAKSAAGVTELDQKIRSTIAAHSKKGAGMRIAELAPKMHSQHGVRISTFPERSWRAYLVARPALYDLDPRGPEAMVRFRPEGFVHARSCPKDGE
ncbi:MAG: NYN domain-containing protein [Paracoccaceae bacterium]